MVNDNCCHTTPKFAVRIKEDQDRLPTIYWLPKLHKRAYKARFISNTTLVLVLLLNFKIINAMPHCYKNNLIKYCETDYESSSKITSACLVPNPITVNNFAAIRWVEPQA